MVRTKVPSNDSHAQPKTSSTATAAECAERVGRLWALTQDDYYHLFIIVRAIVPPQFCDPHDALSHGLLIALQRYDGRGPLTAYVPRCAYLYSLQQVKKRRREINFCDLQTDLDVEDYLDQALPFLEAPATSRRSTNCSSGASRRFSRATTIGTSAMPLTRPSEMPPNC